MDRKANRLVFVDVETIGTIKNPRVIQIAAIATNEFAEELAGFEAKALLPAGNKAKPRHSRYDAKLWKAEANTAQQVAIDFAAFLTRNSTVERYAKSGQMFRVAQLVAHNAEFDTQVLRNWYARLGIYLPAAYQPLCTMQRALWMFQDRRRFPRPSDYRLTTLCRYFEIEHSPKQAHDAFADVRAMLLLYRRMIATDQLSSIDELSVLKKVACG